MDKSLAGLITIFLLQTSAFAADRIRIDYPGPAAQFIPLPLAQNKGFLKQEGLDAEIIQMRSAAAMAGLVSGEIDYFVSIGLAVPAALQGLSVKAVACYVPDAPFDVDRETRV